MENSETKSTQFGLSPVQQVTVAALAQELERLNQAATTVREAMDDLARRYAADLAIDEGTVQFSKLENGQIGLLVFPPVVVAEG